MKREAKLLLPKAISSLRLSIDHFNSSSDIGRTEAVLILLDHAFEMLLKASLIERGAQIRGKGENNTIGFDHCLRKGLTEGGVKFLTEDQVLSRQTLNNYRDAAQHYMLELCEQFLYTTAQTGLTVFQSILRTVFNKELSDYFPNRVLPISTVPAVDIAELFHNEVEAIKILLQPGKRQRTEALARLRPLAIMEEAFQGENKTPSDEELKKLGKAILNNKQWHEVFPGVASIQITTNGYGPSLEMHITRKKGTPIEIVKEGTPNAGVIALRILSDTDHYSLGAARIAKTLNLNQTQVLALVFHLKIQQDSECFKEITIGSQKHKRYSPKTLDKIRTKLAEPDFDMQVILQAYQKRPKTVKSVKAKTTP